MDWTCNVCGWALKDAKNWDSDSICPLCERKGDERAAAGVEHQWMSSSDAVKALIEGRSLEGVFVQQLRLDDLKLENMRLVDCIVLHLSALRVHMGTPIVPVLGLCVVPCLGAYASKGISIFRVHRSMR
jgi:hypothetical protein